eukprot:CAMPEP_0198256992 /NCGR_PEP_ID=MMETSP1447-20131203/6775_1 /TAXON_ID=420782 /ORGANISM="Chaetoceros dichaeta, Strain CCMP1751" /LENGTH=334 /DNA_ID=CAMNT_0043943775 /DNA_START=103 /DNA_END=1107 /DNA_ORIENTATION=-
MSDHMLIVEWDEQNKWGAPKIVPYQNLQISPVASCLNYGITCFEGMKAYKALPDQSLRLFRPELNMKRLQNSMKRLQMPGSDFVSDELIECIKELVKVDSDWIPYGEGYSLYLRPNVIAMHENLGLAAPTSTMLYVVSSPVGPYYKSGFKPIRLQSENSYVRAWPGGTGNSKVGGNYAPAMKPAAEAAKRGYEQVLWLLNDEITEVGAMNVFFLWIDAKTGRKELVTPPLDRGDILPGVTRQSVIELAKSWGEFDVCEKNITMSQVRDAAKDMQIIEAFGTGTAAVVTPISCINYEGVDIEIPATGGITQKIWNELADIQYGNIEHPDGWSVHI